jgi:hypothetical protein
MRNTEKRLGKMLLRGGDKRDIINILSDEFRSFLSFLTDKNCRAMTSREFESISIALEFNGAFLSYFFRICDELRFSGKEIKPEDINELLGDLRGYLNHLSYYLRASPSQRGIQNKGAA